MAEEEKKNEEEGQEEEKSSNKMLIIILVVLVVLVLGGVGAFFALQSGKSDNVGSEELEAELDTGELAPGAILPLQTFIVNLQIKGSFLKSTMQLEFAEPILPPTIDADLPKIRDQVIKVLSSKSSQEILTIEGKEDLHDELLEAINEVLGGEDVIRIYFTEFIVQ